MKGANVDKRAGTRGCNAGPIDIADIEKVETVFKDGVGYDPAKLIQSVTGLVGLR